MSPRAAVNSHGPPAEPHQELPGAPSQDRSSDLETEASPTSPEPAEDEKEDEKVERKEIPHIPRHIGVPIMGMDLLAEMKAKQEQKAAQKVSALPQGSAGRNVAQSITVHHAAVMKYLIFS